MSLTLLLKSHVAPTPPPEETGGVAIEGIDYDYDGVARGTPPDIGALEYVA